MEAALNMSLDEVIQSGIINEKGVANEKVKEPEKKLDAASKEEKLSMSLDDLIKEQNGGGKKSGDSKWNASTATSTPKDKMSMSLDDIMKADNAVTNKGSWKDSAKNAKSGDSNKWSKDASSAKDQWKQSSNNNSWSGNKTDDSKNWKASNDKKSWDKKESNDSSNWGGEKKWDSAAKSSSSWAAPGAKKDSWGGNAGGSSQGWKDEKKHNDSWANSGNANTQKKWQEPKYDDTWVRTPYATDAHDWDRHGEGGMVPLKRGLQDRLRGRDEIDEVPMKRSRNDAIARHLQRSRSPPARDMAAKRARTEVSLTGANHCKRIIVSGIPQDLHPKDLEDAFRAQAGVVQRCKIFDSVALIEFDRSKDAEQAVKVFHGGKLNGCTIKVDFDV